MKMTGLKKGGHNLKKLHAAIKRQRENNITVWISRKLHEKIKKIAFKKGVSITWVINDMLKYHFEKEKK